MVIVHALVGVAFLFLKTLSWFRLPSCSGLPTRSLDHDAAGTGAIRDRYAAPLARRGIPFTCVTGNLLPTRALDQRELAFRQPRLGAMRTSDDKRHANVMDAFVLLFLCLALVQFVFVQLFPLSRDHPLNTIDLILTLCYGSSYKPNGFLPYL